ncbi:MAG: hypothetical protein MUE85_17410 [Microscillaceae bacterium]|jgi:hypothetical protein|nr:hypothetical protein [Microscillaceae bacterium]
MIFATYFKFFSYLNVYYGLVFGLAWGFYWGAFDGYDFFGDDLSYARYAHYWSINQGYVNRDIFTHRLGFILPMAGFYALWGVNDTTTTLLPFVSYVGILSLIYRFFSPSSVWIAIYAAILVGFDFYTLLFSQKVYPDLLLAWVVWALVISLYHRANDWRAVGWSVGLFFYGFLVKETIFYVLPLILFAGIYDLKLRQNQFFWLGFVGLGVAVGVVYLGFYGYFTQDWFYRFHTIQSGHYADATHSYFDKPWQALIPRLTYEPVLMLLNSGMMLVFLPTLPSLGRLYRLAFWDTKNWEFWLVAAFISILGVFWLGSTSWQFYNPIGLLGRMILMLMPIAAVLAAINLERATQQPKYLYFLWIAYALSAIGVYYVFASKLAVVYGLLSIFFGSMILYKRLIINKLHFKNQLLSPQNCLAVGLLVILSIHPLYRLMKPTETHYATEKLIFQNYLQKKAPTHIVYADVATLYSLAFMCRFQVPKNYTFLAYDSLKTYQPLPQTQQLVFVNPAKLQFSNQYGYPIPSQILNPPPTWQLIIDKQGVKVYQIK